MSSRPPEALDPRLFRQACGRFSTGVAIAATLDPSGNPHGLTINSFTSVSLSPPMVLICIDYRAAVLKYFLAASHYGLSFLNAGQQELSDRFALKPDCRFEGTEWRRGITGVPLMEGSIATLECRIERIIEGGDHSILLATVVSAGVAGGPPLIYFNGSYTSA